EAFAKTRLRRLWQVERTGGAGRRRLSIAVAAEGDAKTLPDALGFAVRHMARSPEAQMLPEMRVTKLVGMFHQRPGVHPQANGDLPRRDAIAADGVAQTVGKRAEAPCRVDRHIAVFIEPGAGF